VSSRYKGRPAYTRRRESTRPSSSLELGDRFDPGTRPSPARRIGKPWPVRFRTTIRLTATCRALGVSRTSVGTGYRPVTNGDSLGELI